MVLLPLLLLLGSCSGDGAVLALTPLVEPTSSVAAQPRATATTDMAPRFAWAQTDDGGRVEPSARLKSDDADTPPRGRQSHTPKSGKKKKPHVLLILADGPCTLALPWACPALPCGADWLRRRAARVCAAIDYGWNDVGYHTDPDAVGHHNSANPDGHPVTNAAAGAPRNKHDHCLRFSQTATA